MPGYGSDKKESGGKGGMKDDRSDGRLSSDKGWSVPDGMPEAPGESGKIPRPK